MGAVGEPGSGGAGAAGSGGEPIPHAVRLSLQQDLSADLTEIRVHRGFGQGNVAAAAKASGAAAYTHGKDIYFSAGAYDPHTRSGLELLSHEALHTVQQGAPPAPPDPGERLVATVSGPGSKGWVREWTLRPGEPPRPGWGSRASRP